MKNIIRCPSCFTYVYADARRCHGCGERTGRRRLLTRGSWIFIVLAVTGFAVARGIEIHQEKRDRVRSEFEEAARAEIASKFLHAWLMSDPRGLFESISSPEAFGPDLVKLRAKWPTALPATALVGQVKIEAEEPKGHIRKKGGPVLHRTEEWDSELRVSALPSRPKPVGLLSEIFNLFNQPWTTQSCEFKAEFLKDSQSYTIHGRVCFRDRTVCCLSIDKIVGIEGIVKPTP